MITMQCRSLEIISIGIFTKAQQYAKVLLKGGFQWIVTLHVLAPSRHTESIHLESCIGWNLISIDSKVN